MTMNKAALVILLLLATSWSLPAGAQEQTGPTTREKVEAQLEDLKQRLDLSEYTWNQVHLILKTSIRERIAIAKKYGLEEISDLEDLSGKEQRRLRKELKNSRKSTAERMERYLDKDQMKEFKVIQEEVHEEMLTHLAANTE